MKRMSYGRYLYTSSRSRSFLCSALGESEDQVEEGVGLVFTLHMFTSLQHVTLEKEKDLGNE